MVAKTAALKAEQMVDLKVASMAAVKVDYLVCKLVDYSVVLRAAQRVV
jgi:hypothetical protein